METPAWLRRVKKIFVKTPENHSALTTTNEITPFQPTKKLVDIFHPLDIRFADNRPEEKGLLIATDQILAGGILENSPQADIHPLAQEYRVTASQEIAGMIINHENDNPSQKKDPLEIELMAETGSLGADTIAIVLDLLKGERQNWKDPHEHLLILGSEIHGQIAKTALEEIMVRRQPASGLFANYSILVVDAGSLTDNAKDEWRWLVKRIQEISGETDLNERSTIIWLNNQASFSDNNSHISGMTRDEQGQHYQVARLPYKAYESMLPPEWRVEGLQPTIETIVRGNLDFLQVALEEYDQRRTESQSTAFDNNFIQALFWRWAKRLGVENDLIQTQNTQLLQRLIQVTPLFATDGFFSPAKQEEIDGLAQRLMPEGNLEAAFDLLVHLSSRGKGFEGFFAGRCGEMFRLIKAHSKPTKEMDKYKIDPNTLAILEYLSGQGHIADPEICQSAVDRGFLRAVVCDSCHSLRKAYVDKQGLIQPQDQDNCAHCGAPGIMVVNVAPPEEKESL